MELDRRTGGRRSIQGVVRSGGSAVKECWRGDCVRGEQEGNTGIEMGRRVEEQRRVKRSREGSKCWAKGFSVWKYIAIPLH